ncbi:lysozyme inhibitor LprI family protein [Psychrobacter sp. I-STPA6b]|uniref:lysozyme inhibitor LprI family protein n=1 Tax=Psychrobacter sp. I-STPA6b TaxID=2585718 RepID=UPI001D0C7FAA|nr:lysozyme inhibitor LprI family protein [Psychrobacter sp. I-STPA6b]
MTKSIFTNLAVFVSCLVSMPAFSASFDCAKASSWVEKTICSNAQLSSLDEQMARHYKNSLTNASDNPNSTQITHNAQRRWLKFQRNTCTTQVCLIREYQEYLGEQSTYIGVEDNPEALSKEDLPNSKAFGQFSTIVNISVYDLDTQRWQSTGDSVNSISIYPVSNKPYLAIVTGDLIYTNAHTCSFDDEKATWSENHWVLTNSQAGTTSELRLYPATHQDKTQLLLRDIDNQYRETHCGMRGYLDGIVLDAE